MYSSGELEGEVDHSFFDSDCDDGSIRKDRGKKVEKRLEAERGSLPVPDHIQSRQRQSQTEAVVGGDGALRPEGAINPQNEGEKNHIGEAEKAEDGYSSEVEDICRSSSISSIACMSDKVVRNGSDVELASIRSKSDLASLGEYKEEDDDEDGYHQSQDESEEEEGVPAPRRFPGLKGGRVGTPKKLVRRRPPRSPSPVSSEPGSCTDTGSSCSSSDESFTLEPAAALSRPKTALPSSSPRMRRPRLGSAGAGERPLTPTEESEDTVTDVTPLSTPEISPLKCLDLTQGSVWDEAENGQRLEEQTEPESAPSSGLSNVPQEDESSEDVDKSSLGLESRLGSQLVFHCPSGRNRKNYSFTNDEVRRIDRENQRLLQELSRPSPQSRPGSTIGGKSNTANNPPPVRPYHSALNRHREQQRIERENLAFLKRLETIKPTVGMQRSEQLADYQRQARYPGNGSLPIYRSPPKTEKASSRIPSGKGSRPATAVHCSTRPATAVPCSTRPASAAVDSINTPVSRSNKASVPRPAWC